VAVLPHRLVNKCAKQVVSISSRLRGGQKLWILIFHRVLDKPDPLRPGEIDSVTFDKVMCLLADFFNVFSLDEAVERLQSGSLPPRAVSITFDDGYADNLTTALPILKKYKLPATVFVSTGFLDGGRMWNDTIIESVRCWQESVIDLSELQLGVLDCETEHDKSNVIASILGAIKYFEPCLRQEFVDIIEEKVECLPTDMMLTTEGVKSLYANGIEIGAHTVTHPILTSLNDRDAKSEIAKSKEQLEYIIGDGIRYFAYPNGRYKQDYNQRHVDILKRLNFKAALSTHWGVGTASTDKMQLPRFTPWDRTTLPFLFRAARIYQKTM